MCHTDWDIVDIVDIVEYGSNTRGKFQASREVEASPHNGSWVARDNG